MYTTIKNTATLLILLINLVSLPGFSQSGTVTAGASVKSANGSLSWSAGQVFTQTISDGNISVSEGLQQPYEIHDVVSTFDQQKLDIRIWPNPVSDMLTVNIRAEDITVISFTVTTVDGRMLKSGAIEELTKISLTGVMPGILILSFQYKNQFLSSYKIIKQ